MATPTNPSSPPIDPTDSADATSGSTPTRSAEATDGAVATETADPTRSAEATDGAVATETADPTRSAEATDGAVATETADPTRSAEATDGAVATETADPTRSAEATDGALAPESADPTNSAGPTQSSEAAARDEAIRRVLRHGQTIDITTTGRRTGLPRRIEIALHSFGGHLYISGTPSPSTRAWIHNLRADPGMTVHLKQLIAADLPATAREITDEAERRAVLAKVARVWKRDPEPMVRFSPLIEVSIEGVAPA